MRILRSFFCSDKKKGAAVKKAFKAKSKEKHPATMKQRYARRNIANKNYGELESSGDEGEFFLRESHELNSLCSI